MDLLNALSIGLKEIAAHRFRSLLTMLGIILGVSSLVAMSSLVKGMENGFREALVEMGGLKKIRIEGAKDLPVYQRYLRDEAPGITLDDVYALESSAPLVDYVVPIVEQRGWDGRVNVTYRDKVTHPWRLYGTWPGILDVDNHKIHYGRMFNEIDNERARNVCVIGAEIRNELFGDPMELGHEVNPVGKVINMSGQAFTIVGVFKHYMSEKEKKALEIERQQQAVETGPKRDKGWRKHGPAGWVYGLKNHSIDIPLNTMLLKMRSAISESGLADDNRLSQLAIKLRSLDLLEPSLQQIRNVLMVTHKGIEDWSFRTEEDFADDIHARIKNFRMSGGVIAAICLVVGGIGIMNIMLASISERVREIGIRKSVGATTEGIFVQILIESLALAMLGGLFGLVVSVLIVEIIAAFTPTANTPEITLAAMGLAVLASASVGILAGLIPAVKAARLHPIQALKYD